MGGPSGGGGRLFRKLSQGPHSTLLPQPWGLEAQLLGTGLPGRESGEGEEGGEGVRATEGGGGAMVRRGDAIGTRHSSLTVGNAADRDDGSQSWHHPTASPLPGSPTGLPPRSSSCSPPRAHQQQPRWRGGQRVEGEGCLGRQPSARRPALAQTRPDPTSCLPGAAANELALAGPASPCPVLHPPEDPGRREAGSCPALPEHSQAPT